MKKPFDKKKIIMFLAFALALSIMLAGCNLFTFNKTTVNFYDGDTLVKTISVINPQKLNAPSVEDKDGYRAVGWKDADGIDFSAEYDFKNENDFFVVKEPIVYNIEYELNEGENAEGNPATYTVEDSFTLDDATKEDFDFLGWSIPGNPTPTKDLSIPAGTMGDLKFTANFAEKDRWYLFYQTNGGNEIERTESALPLFAEAPAPTRTGYAFNGWYRDENRTIPARFPLTTLEKVTTIYADWTPVTYHVFAANGEFEPIGFTVETESFTLGEIEKEGYTFLGYSEGNSSVIRESYTVNKGTAKDITLTVRYKINEYTITFDTLGGSEVPPATVEFGAEISAPEDPVKDGCDFLGWYLEALCENEFTFSTMPAHDIKLYAGWYSDDNFTLRYSASDPDAVVVGNRESGAMFLSGERVRLTAPVFCDGGTFLYWTRGTAIFDYSNELDFPMPTGNLNLVATYATVVTYDYDKASGGDLEITSGNDLVSADGARATIYDYTISGKKLILKERFLRSLDSGYYTFILRGSTSSETVAVSISDTGSSIERLKIDYDVNYPEVTLMYKGEEGAAYEYSLDNSAYVLAESGTILSGYTKNRSHTLRIRRAGNPEDSASVTKAAYPLLLGSYLNQSFNYGGGTYDHYIEDKDEFDAILQYIVYVYAPLNRSGRTSQAPGGSASLRFALSDEFNSEIEGKERIYFTELFNKGGVPYAPTYSFNSDNTSRQVWYLNISFRTDTPNEFASGQEEEAVSDAQKLLKSSSRGNSFNDFAIERLEKTQQIRTLYELENLPFGVKPTFSETTSQAYRVYQKAKEILRSCVDDDMNDFEKVSAIYNYIALNFTYDDYVAEHAEDSDIGKYTAFTSFGTLIHRVAVCDGIASAMRIMCQIEGIECEEVAGNGKGGAHAWNKVNVYGKWYIADATWSHVSTESETYVSHRHFLCSDIVSEKNGHLENATMDQNIKYADNVAIGALDYYTVELVGEGLDYTATNADEFYRLVKARYDAGASVVELKYVTSGFGDSITMSISRARTRLGRNISYYVLEDNVYLIVIG